MQSDNVEFFTLAQGKMGIEYLITKINTQGDKEMEAFLFSLGCYEGQKITIVSMLHKNYLVSIKDARYSIDEALAGAIHISISS